MSLLTKIFQKQCSKAHWERTYQKKAPDEVTWYQRVPSVSLELISNAGVPSNGRIIDMGGGASTLVDRLLSAGYRNLEVLDISGSALLEAKARLSILASRIRWTEADVTTHQFEDAAYDLWHDRAVFHFLTAPGQKKAYKEALSKALRPGGHIVISTFSLEGPRRCNGLPVARYDAAGLSKELGEGYTLIESRGEIHIAPTGHRQGFVFGLFRKEG